LSADRENLEKQFDELKEKTLGYMDNLGKLNAEAEELRTARREAEEKAWAAEEKITKLGADLEEQNTKIEKLEQDLQETKSELSSVKEEANAATAGKDDEIAAIINERDELKAEMEQINSQLEKVSELYRETSAEKEKLEEKVDVSDLLAIYIVLIEQIFGGKPHARVLYTLHNAQAAITRKNIISSTGIMPTAVTKAVHDLRNADLVTYDDETQEVKLIKDIF
jgi:outer membrane murein-binding lipoprotein Lpp